MGGDRTLDEVWMPFLISSLVLAFSVAASSQLFAAVRDDSIRSARFERGASVAIVRMALTQAGSSDRWSAWLAAATSCAPALDDRSVRPCSDHPIWGPSSWPNQATDSNSSSVERLTAITLAHNSAATRVHRSYVLVYAGESVKYGFLPL